MEESAVVPGSTPLRPDFVHRLQEAYFSSFEIQVVSTIVLALLFVGGVVATYRLKSKMTSRYGENVTEATAITAVIFVIVGTVYALSVVWYVTAVVRLTIQSLLVDRTTATQQIITGTVVVIAYLLVRFINRSIDKLQETDSLTEHQSEVAYHVSNVGITAVAGGVVMTVWGIDLSSVFLGAGAIVAIVAVTARETLQGMIAGFTLLFSRPFRVGDWIEVNGRSGIVTDVTIFNTKIQTFDDKHVLVPNDEVTSSQLTNYSRNDQLRIEVEVGVDYDTDVDHALETLTDAVDDLEAVKGSPNPQAVTKEFADSAILLELHVWISDPTMRNQWAARTDAMKAIQRTFEREGIEIPYPQRVHSARGDEFRISGPESRSAGLQSIDD